MVVCLGEKSVGPLGGCSGASRQRQRIHKNIHPVPSRRLHRTCVQPRSHPLRPLCRPLAPRLTARLLASMICARSVHTSARSVSHAALALSRSSIAISRSTTAVEANSRNASRAARAAVRPRSRSRSVVTSGGICHGDIACATPRRRAQAGGGSPRCVSRVGCNYEFRDTTTTLK